MYLPPCSLVKSTTVLIESDATPSAISLPSRMMAAFTPFLYAIVSLFLVFSYIWVIVKITFPGVGCAFLLFIITAFVSAGIKTCDELNWPVIEQEKPKDNYRYFKGCPECGGRGYIYTFYENELHDATKKQKIMFKEYKEKRICFKCSGKGKIYLTQ